MRGRGGKRKYKEKRERGEEKMFFEGAKKRRWNADHEMKSSTDAGDGGGRR